MTPQELKNSILQLAIQGKLVEQRPEEGTAAELLEKILAAKNAKDAKGKGEKSHAKSAKSTKVGSRVSHEEIPDDEKPFEIPERWEWVRLGEVIDYRMGKTPPRADLQWWAPDIPWVSIADMPESGHVLTTKERVSRSAIESLFGGRISNAGTLLMSFKLTVGRVSILDVDAVHNEAIISIFPCHDEQGIFKSYLFLILPFVTQFGDSKSAIKGKTLNSKSICNLPIPLPPLAEQKRIVAKIEELLPLIDCYEKAWSKLEDFNKRFPVDMQKSLLQMAIQGKLVEQRAEESTGAELLEKILAAKNAKDAKSAKKGYRATSAKSAKAGTCVSSEEIPDDEKPFEIPESWVWVRLGDIATVLGGKRIPAGRQLTTENTGHIYIRVSDMKNDGVSMEHLMYVPSDIYPSISRYIITKEDVYITVAGTIGRVGKIPPELDGANLTENADRLVFKRIDQEWLIQCLKTVVVQNQILDCTTKVGQPKLAIKRIQELIIPLPPLAEQKRIVAKLEELLPLCEQLKLLEEENDKKSAFTSQVKEMSKITLELI